MIYFWKIQILLVTLTSMACTEPSIDKFPEDGIILIPGGKYLLRKTSGLVIKP